MSTCLHKLSCHSNVDKCHGHYGHVFSCHVGIHQGECKHGEESAGIEKGGGMVIMVILATCGKSRQIWRAIYLYVYIYIFFLKYEINDQYDHITPKPANSTR